MEIENAVEVLKQMKIDCAAMSVNGVSVIEPLTMAIEALEKQIVVPYKEPYEPMCPHGYTDCIYDCNYMKYYHPASYKRAGSPTECTHCEDGSDYDDEDK